MTIERGEPISPTVSEIHAAVERAITSPMLSKSDQLAGFLRFVVQERLAGRGDRIKAYTIATAALGRDENFDPQIDPIVRVEAGRLRRALRQYYAQDGRLDPIIIELPVGHYMPVFRRNPALAKAAPGKHGRWHRLADTAREHRSLLLLVVVIAAVVAVSVDMLEMLFAKTVWPMITHLARSAMLLLPATDGTVP